MAKRTPLQVALETPRRGAPYAASKEQQDVAIAWLQDRIGMTQAAAGLGEPRSGTVLYKIACYLRSAHRDGRIIVDRSSAGVK